MPPWLQAVAPTASSDVLPWILGVVSALATAVATVAGAAWRSQGAQVKSLSEQLAKRDDLVNEIRQAQLAELRNNLIESNRNLNAATAAIQGSTAMLESRSELEDKILELARQNSADITKMQIALDRIERATDGCRTAIDLGRRTP